MLLTMVKMEIIGPKKYFYQTVALLHKLGTLHVEDLSKKDDIIFRRMDIDEEASQSKTDLRSLLTRLNSIISVIEPSDFKKIASKKEDANLYWNKSTIELIEETNKLLAELEEETRALANKKSDLELELASLGRYQDVIQKIYPLAKSIVTLKDAETVAFLLEGDYKETINVMNRELGKITNDQHELISTPIDGDTTAAIIVFSKKFSVKIHHFLKDKVNELNLPGGMKDLTIEAVVREIEKRQASYPNEIKEIQNKLNNISADWYYKLTGAANAIHNKIDELEKMQSFGQTDYTFVVHGWLPHKHMDNLKKEISKTFSNKVLVRQLELTHEDLEQAPVVLENKPWIKPYEVLLKIFSPPKYGTIDPTLFMAIFFPLFFGFIVGDIGYGLVIFGAATIMRYKLKDQESEVINAVTRIFQFAGISAILFGFFFAEFFGTILEHYLAAHHIEMVLGPITWPYSRNPEVAGRAMELLITSAIFGYIHLLVSLIMGVANAIREKARKHMWEKIGLMLFLLSVTTLIYGIAKKAPHIITSPALMMVFVSIGLVAYGGGPLAAFEHTIGLIANIASYFRLMALGLAGAILAAVADSFVSTLGLEFGIFMAILLHTINVVVHTVSPTIHSIRLNMLEGFGKFYEEGGKEYKPFKARR